MYGNVSYEISLTLYGYETYTDTIELADDDLDLGTFVLQEDFIPAVNVVASDTDTEAFIQWTNPADSYRDYLINDMNEDMGGLANEPYEDVWLGNRFENSGILTLTGADVFFTFDDGGAPESVTVDVFKSPESGTAMPSPWPSNCRELPSPIGDQDALPTRTAELSWPYGEVSATIVPAPSLNAQ